MKISELIAELQNIQVNEGDIPIQLQSDEQKPLPDRPGETGIICYPNPFLVVEKYEDGQWLSIRSWPY
jgi:hypothetical protein